jgi:uncharacterized protein
MKRFLLLTALCIAFPIVGAAQQAAADAPASKEDIERYLQVMHSREMVAKMMDAMTKPINQMIHERYLRDKDKLPPDFEARTTKLIDDYMRNFPFEEVQQAMVPSYQKHLNKRDIDALITFYSSPTGEKVIREMPEMIAEAMQATMPIIQQRAASLRQHVQQEMAQMVKDSKTGQRSQATPN